MDFLEHRIILTLVTRLPLALLADASVATGDMLWSRSRFFISN